MSLKVLFIMNGIGKSGEKVGISGGDVRWIEIAKEWQKIGVEIHVLTLDAGEELCRRLGLNAIFYHIKAPSKYSLFSYIIRFFNSIKIPKELKNFDGIICTTTDHIYDVLPGVLLKRKNKNKLIITAHWVAPLIRKGTSLSNSVFFYLNQRSGYFLTKKYADIVLAVSESTKQAILNKIKIPEDKIKVVEAGVHYEKIRNIASNIKKNEYSGVFMKRFDGTKGVFDIIEIWKRVVKEISDAKLILIGHGTNDTLRKLKVMIKKNDLEDNIQILGIIYDFDRKFETLARSKIFLLPSYEENWAIVIGEAMATGLPVVCYELPEIQPIWKDNVIWVPKGNKEIFAKKIVGLLQNEDIRNELGNRCVDFVKKYDWKEIAKKEMDLVLDN